MNGIIIIYSLLAGAVVVGSLASLSSRPHIRGWRNLALLAALVLGIISPFVAGWTIAFVVWLSCAAFSAIACKVYDAWGRRRHPPEDNDFPASVVSLFISGLFLWPLLFLEAFEYTCAELFPSLANPEADPEAAQP